MGARFSLFQVRNKMGHRRHKGKTKKKYRPDFRLNPRPPLENIKRGLHTVDCVMGEVAVTACGKTMAIAKSQAARQMLDLIDRHASLAGSKYADLSTSFLSGSKPTGVVSSTFVSGGSLSTVPLGLTGFIFGRCFGGF